MTNPKHRLKCQRSSTGEKAFDSDTAYYVGTVLVAQIKVSPTCFCHNPGIYEAGLVLICLFGMQYDCFPSTKIKLCEASIVCATVYMLSCSWDGRSPGLKMERTCTEYPGQASICTESLRIIFIIFTFLAHM